MIRICILVFCTVSLAWGQDHDRELRVDSLNLAFSVVAPRGWAKIPESLPNAEDYLLVLRHADAACGADLQASLWRNEGPRLSLKDFVARDIAELKDSTPTARVIDSATIKTQDAREAIVKHVFGLEEESNCAVAYLESRAGHLVILSMGGANGTCFPKLLSDFEAFVRSYREVERK